MMQWTRPEIYKAVYELSHQMNMASELHHRAMLTTMDYCVRTRNQGLFLKPTRNWDGKVKTFAFFYSQWV